jgi:hypothetical protein
MKPNYIYQPPSIGNVYPFPHARAARTQRDAGIEFKEWEGRLAPIRPWASDILSLVGIIGLASAVLFLLQVFFAK